MSLSKGLLSQQSQRGLKKEKNRISVAICVNATGTDRFPLWFIGKAKTPRALRNIDVSAMGGVWRWNKKAWMNQFIMKEWLTAFYCHCGLTRSILLTMDNFKAHIAAIQLAPPPPNIRIIWLPPNGTSLFQALDQGIIASLKAQYRRQWLQYMLQAYESHLDPIKSMNIHLCLRWLIRSWNHDVTNTTIYNCFRKSTIIQHPIQLPAQPLPDLNTLYQQVQQAGFIHDAMDISNFLNPVEESIQEAENDIAGDALLEELMADYMPDSEAQNDDYEDEQPMQPVLTPQAALQAIQTLIDYTESGNSGISEAPSTLRSLERVERQIQLHMSNQKSRSTLDSWVT